MRYVLSAWAKASPEHFAKYIGSPKSENPYAQRHPNPSDDDPALEAQTAYFRSFLAPFQEKP